MRISPMILFWVALLTSTHLIAGLGIFDNVQTQVAVSVLGLSHSIVGFWKDAGRRIGAPSVSFFATGLFVFFPGLYSGLEPDSTYGHIDMTMAVTYALIVQILTYHLIWEPRTLPAEIPDKDEPPAAVVPGRTGSMIVGLMFLAAGIGASLVGYGREPFVEGAAYVGVVLFSVSALSAQKKIFFVYIVIGLAFLAYMELVFSGFGRLKIGSLGLALAIALWHRWRGRSVKLFILLVSTPVLLLLAQNRVEVGAALNADQEASVTGLESVLSPLARFAQLLEMNSNGLDHTWLHTFFVSAIALVPRAIWPDKPVGFGSDLATLFRPDLDGTGHSELALFHGEWIYGFGVIGLVGMLVFYGWFVLFVDRTLVRSRSALTRGGQGIVLLAIYVVLGSSLVDLIWGGTFTYVSRVGPRLILLGIAYMILIAPPWLRSFEPASRKVSVDE